LICSSRFPVEVLHILNITPQFIAYHGHVRTPCRWIYEKFQSPHVSRELYLLAALRENGSNPNAHESVISPVFEGSTELSLQTRVNSRLAAPPFVFIKLTGFYTTSNLSSQSFQVSGKPWTFVVSGTPVWQVFCKTTLRQENFQSLPRWSSRSIWFSPSGN
jgi:hypothetical protein